MREYRRGVSTGNQERRQMARTKPWELSEEVWERAQPLLPERKPHPRGGRPPRDDRQMLGAILYVLRTGLQWNALPHEICASTTVYRASPPSSAATRPTSAHAVRSAPTPARSTRSSGRAAGWWSGCIAGLIARVDCWYAGRSWGAPTERSCTWPVPSSAFSNVPATERL